MLYILEVAENMEGSRGRFLRAGVMNLRVLQELGPRLQSRVGSTTFSYVRLFTGRQENRLPCLRVLSQFPNNGIPSTSFPIHYVLIVQHLDAVHSELQTRR
jgi:hypothetical protein